MFDDFMMTQHQTFKKVPIPGFPCFHVHPPPPSPSFFINSPSPNPRNETPLQTKNPIKNLTNGRVLNYAESNYHNLEANRLSFEDRPGS